MENKLIFLTLILSLFLISLVGASFQDEVIKQAGENKYTVPTEYCSTLKYKFYTRYLRDFIFEVKVINTDENFFIIIRENNCTWNVDILNEINKKPDILITGEYTGDDGLYLENEKIQAKSLKGFFLSRIADDYI